MKALPDRPLRANLAEAVEPGGVQPAAASTESLDASGWLPATLLDLLHAGRAVQPPDGGMLAAATLLVDVSGFTALTERLAESGPDGAERLSAILDACFGPLIDTVAAHGGDISHFAGDAILACWPVQHDSADALEDALENAVARATACVRAVQALPPMAGDGALPLRVRAGVAAGCGWWAVLGDDEERLFVVGGPPVVDAAAAAAAAGPGEWALHDSARALAGGGGGSSAAALTVAPAATTATAPTAVPTAVLPAVPMVAAPARPLRDPRIEPFLPQTLRRRRRGAAGGAWLAEFRRITVLYAGFGELDFAAPGRLAQAQAALQAVQAVLRHFDGALYQLVADGPGAMLIAAWGLPTVTHEDDARRGVEAALAIEAALQTVGLSVVLGVATGRVFSGLCGNATRREWALSGDAMNLAARLMRAAEQGRRIDAGASALLCDEDTARAAGPRQRFDARPPLALKGKARPVPVFVPGAAAAAPALRPRSTLVGRALQAQRIDARLDAFVQQRAGGALLLEGEAGIGKSTLLAELARRAGERGATVLRGDADAIESATAYYVWRPLLAALFGLPPAGGSAAWRERVQAALQVDAALAARAPLLNDVLALDLPDSDETAPMLPQGRADALRDLVAALLQRAAASAPLVLVLDDAHWFDSASWALLAAAVARAPEVLFVVATRPIAEPLPPPLRQLLAGGAERLMLPPLDRAEVLALVCRRLGVAALPPAAQALIAEKAQGNPFFAEQLALALCDAGHLLLEDGAAGAGAQRSCRLAASERALQALALPDTVQGVVGGRIDRLAEGERLTLKVASAIGRVFVFRLLHEVHPAAPPLPALRGQLDRLTALDLTRLDTPEPELSHLFTHVITQQVAYDLMSFAQRRALHRTIALWLEQRFGDDLAPHLPVLAHHWARADEPARAVSYLERAAAQALERFANQEVLHFVAEARALAAQGALDIDARRRARWELCEGEALLKLARYADSRTHFRASLQLLGWPVPQARGTLAAALLAAVAQQAARRLRGRAPGTPWPAAADAPQRDARLQAAHLHQRLAEVGYWEHDMLTLLHSAVASLNFAEPAGVSQPLLLAHHVLGFVAGLAGSAALWRRYRGHADRVALQVRHLETEAYRAQLDAIYFNARGRWAEMHDSAQRGAAGFERIGERFRWLTCVVLRAWGTLHQGDVAAARALFEQVQQLFGGAGPTQVQVWSSAGLLAADLAENGRAGAGRIDELEALLAQGVDHSDAILCGGLLALAHHRAGQRGPALAHAERTTRLVERLPPASFHTLLGTAAVAELRCAEWAGNSDRAARAAARHALRGLARFALACPIGRPHLWRLRAEFARLQGDARLQARCTARARAEAERLGMVLPDPAPVRT